MHQQIYVNLPVKDLAASRAFFEALGYPIDPRFSNDRAACVRLGEHIFAMLLVEPFFQTFTTKPIADAKAVTEVLNCLSCGSRAEVEAIVAKALAAGATAPNPPQDHGFMYGHGFVDLDGHGWEVMWMDMAAMPKDGPAA